MKPKKPKRVVKFVYDNLSRLPMIAHGKGFKCPYDDLSLHNPVECGDQILFTLANESENVLWKQPFLAERFANEEA